MKKSVCLILAVIFAVTLAISVYAASGDTVVYRTASGSKYHKEDCASLKGNGIAITLQEAVDKGLEPCSKCNPPTLDEASSADTTAVAAAAATGTAAAAVSAASESSGGLLGNVSPVLTFFIGLLVGAAAMVIVYRKFAPAVLAAQAEGEEAEASEE